MSWFDSLLSSIRNLYEWRPRMNPIIDSLPNSPSQTRDGILLEAVIQGRFDPVEFTAIVSGPVTFFVMNDALKIEGVRITTDHVTAQSMADVLYCVIPTAKMVDLTLARCPKEKRLEFKTRSWNYDPVVTGMNTDRMIEQSKYIDSVTQGRKDLLVSIGKDWVTDEKLLAAPNMSANYGAFKANGTPWQSVSTFHEWSYEDYSQQVRGYARMCVVNGKAVDIENVWADPELAHWIANVPKGRALKIARHPRSTTRLQALPFMVDLVNGLIDMFDDPQAGPDVLTSPAHKPLDIKFVQAKNFYPTRRGNKVIWIILHCMQHPEKATAAEANAAWIAGPNAPQVSWHYGMDVDSAVQSVRLECAAWHASIVNNKSIGIEHAGYYDQTAEQWLDGYSQQMLELSARICAEEILAKPEYSHIPVAFVDAEGLLKEEPGFSTHAEVTKAHILAKQRKLTSSIFYTGKSDHQDPGKNFPMTWYLEQVKKAQEVML